MTRKELIEKLLATGTDDSEVMDLFDGDTFKIEKVTLGRPNPRYDSGDELEEGEPERLDEDIILLNVVNDN